MVFVRSLHSPVARPLAGTEGDAEGAPFWSPDGRHLAFFTGRELRRLALADGTVQRICALPTSGYFAGDWGESGTILLAGTDAGRGSTRWPRPVGSRGRSRRWTTRGVKAAT